MHIRAVKCVQGQVQHTLSEVQVIVNTEFEDTISARVSPIIVLKVFLVERLGIALGLFWGQMTRGTSRSPPPLPPPPLQVVLGA